MMNKMKILVAILTGLVIVAACGNNSSKKGETIKLELNYPTGFEQVIAYGMSTTGSEFMDLDHTVEVKFKLDSVINKGNCVVKT